MLLIISACLHVVVHVVVHTPPQGYKIIGSHSGVKMCRWTKSMLRGRGGCYKVGWRGGAGVCIPERKLKPAR